jgi:hypothetical protein
MARSGRAGVSCATVAMLMLRGDRDVAVVRLQLTEQRGEQAGLAGAVASDHAHAPAHNPLRGPRRRVAEVKESMGRGVYRLYPRSFDERTPLPLSGRACSV